MEYYKYTGEPMLTRGEYGVIIEGGRSLDGHTIISHDPDFGDMIVGYVGDPDWVPISEEEWDKL